MKLRSRLSALNLPYSTWPSIVLLLLLTWIIFSPSMVEALYGQGGFLSELSLGDSVEYNLFLSNNTDGPVTLGSAPAITTLPVVDNIVTSATLTGSVSSLNSMPQAQVWFEWGYSSGNLTNSTPVATITATGNKSALISITQADIGDTIYYRIASTSDGTTYGAEVNFVAGGGVGANNRFAKTLFLAVVILVTAMMALVVRRSPMLMFSTLATGAIVYYIIGVIMGLL